MATMTTVMAQRSDSANAREFTAPTHTLAAPFIVKQNRKTPPTSVGRATDSISIIRGGVDLAGVPLVVPTTIRVEVTRQANTHGDVVAAAKALLREIIASENFDAMVAGQAYLQ